MFKDRFQVKFLEPTVIFLGSLDKKTKKKVIYNIDKAKKTRDPKLFKKLNEEIWEFRTLYSKQQIRLLAFWDTTDEKETLVIATHGFIKKTKKTPKKEIKKALRMMKKYFNEKESQ
jgi:phage-related protein